MCLGRKTLCWPLLHWPQGTWSASNVLLHCSPSPHQPSYKNHSIVLQIYLKQSSVKNNYLRNSSVIIDNTCNFWHSFVKIVTLLRFFDLNDYFPHKPKLKLCTIFLEDWFIQSFNHVNKYRIQSYFSPFYTCHLQANGFAPSWIHSDKVWNKYSF